MFCIHVQNYSHDYNNNITHFHKLYIVMGIIQFGWYYCIGVGKRDFMVQTITRLYIISPYSKLKVVIIVVTSTWPNAVYIELLLSIHIINDRLMQSYICSLLVTS